MGLYNVIEPCEVVSGDTALQFVRPTLEFQPVELDDDAAAKLVAEGKLSAYEPSAVDGPTGTPADGDLIVDGEPSIEAEPAPTPRRKRARADDED